MDGGRFKDAQGGRVEDKAGFSRVLPAFFFTMLCGVFLAYFSNMYVSGVFDTVRFDVLSSGDNPELSDPRLPRSRERVSSKGGDLTIFRLEGSRQSIPFRAEDPKTLNVKMSAYFPEVRYNRPALAVSVNGHEIASLRPGWKGEKEKFDFDIPRSVLTKGKNLLTFDLIGGASYMIGYEGIYARDFAGVSKRFPRAYVLFDENLKGKAPDPYVRPYDYILFPASVFLIWILGANLIRAVRGTTALSGSKTLFYFYLPVCAMFISSALFSGVSRYTVVLAPSTFYILVFAPGILCASYGLLPYLPGRERMREKRDNGTRERPPSEKLRFMGRAFKFIYRNAGSIAVAVFAVFLSSAGVFLILKRQDIADNLADIAYFSIVFAVIVRAFEVKGAEKTGE